LKDPTKRYKRMCTMHTLNIQETARNNRDLKIPLFWVWVRVGLPALSYTGNQSNSRYTGYMYDLMATTSLAGLEINFFVREPAGD